MQTPLSAISAEAERGEGFRALCDVIAMVLDVPVVSITPETCPLDLPNWSSLTFMVLMTAIEKRFGVVPDHEQAMDAATVGELARLIDGARAHG